MPAKAKHTGWITTGTVAQNRKARFNYEIHEKIEAGMILMGSEVKSLRLGRANIAESYASEENGQLYLINSYIAEYGANNHFGHAERRPRQLLLRKKELNKILGALNKKGFTIVPLSLYFNNRGLAKVELGIGTGKKLHDKRDTEKNRDWERDKARIIRSQN